MISQVNEKRRSKVLTFPKENILEQGIKQVNRSLELKRDFFLDNSGRDTVKIFFTDHTGLREIETTCWTLTNKAIVLRQAITIPLAKIVAVA